MKSCPSIFWVSSVFEISEHLFVLLTSSLYLHFYSAQNGHHVVLSFSVQLTSLGICSSMSIPVASSDLTSISVAVFLG